MKHRVLSHANVQKYVQSSMLKFINNNRMCYGNILIYLSSYGKTAKTAKTNTN